MCCLISSLLLFGPRIAFLVYWLLMPRGGARVRAAFGNWLVPLLGVIFLPWTALAYAIFFPVAGFEWLLLVLAFLIDLTAYGGGYRSRGTVLDRNRS
jgi:hypothetical protein